MEFLNIKDEVGDDLSNIDNKLKTIDENVKTISNKDFTITVNVRGSGGTYRGSNIPQASSYTDTRVWGKKNYGTYGKAVTWNDLFESSTEGKMKVVKGGEGAIYLGNGRYIKTANETNANAFIQELETVIDMSHDKFPGSNFLYNTAKENFLKKWNPPDKPKPIWYRYATGGLADFNGPAWLDGTKSRPELVLNPRDTENFIQLKDILSSIMSNNIPTITEGARTANSNFEININVDSISSDYDVDRLVERVKKDIVEDSSYRNPVVLNLLR